MTRFFRRSKTEGQKHLYGSFLILLLIFSLYLTYQLVEPFLHALILSGVLSIMFSPIMGRMQDVCKGRRSWAALLTVLIIVVLILIPLAVVLFALIGQGVQSMGSINKWILGTDFRTLLDSGHVATYLQWFHEHVPFITINELEIQNRVLELSKDFAQTMVGLGTNLVRNAARIFFLFLLMVFSLYYFLRDGMQMVKYIKHLSPLRARQEDYIIDSLKRIARGVLMGCLLVALLQGIVGGMGLAFCGIPGIFWGAMTAFCSLVPVVGTGIIWVPAALYLLVVGNWELALFLTLWFSVGVVSIDTFLRPYFMREAAQVSTFYIFLAILGGVYTFGMLGIIYGPLILSFVMVMLRIYSEEYAELLADDSEPVKEEA